MADVSDKLRPENWPMYRHDSSRSGRTSSAVSSDLTKLWKTDIGGKLTQAVIAGDQVLVASVDQHKLCSLDINDGSTVWSYVAGGRIDSSPTVSDGRVLFGSHDGWVYCLRASDGELAWRFCAAPIESRLIAFGQLESPWPVIGSVLVHDGVAYVSAGRSSYLDGGIYLYGLDIKTSQVVHTRRMEGPWPDISKDAGKEYSMLSAKADILTCNGIYLSMGPHEFKMNLTDQMAFKPDQEGNSSKSDL